MQDVLAHVNLIQDGNVQRYVEFVDSARSGTLKTSDIFEAFPTSVLLDKSTSSNVFYARTMEAIPFNRWLEAYVQALKEVPRYVAK